MFLDAGLWQTPVVPQIERVCSSWYASCYCVPMGLPMLVSHTHKHTADELHVYSPAYHQITMVVNYFFGLG
jgi:hypothetical protein